MPTAISEETALTTIPMQPERLVSSYDPQTPTPIPTPMPTATPAAVAVEDLKWQTYVGPLAQQKCVMCHGTLGGLSLASYAEAMVGGQNGVIILPGDSENSNLILVQAPGNHPGQLSPEELDLLKAWIDAGAPK